MLLRLSRYCRCEMFLTHLLKTGGQNCSGIRLYHKGMLSARWIIKAGFEILRVVVIGVCSLGCNDV
jgi:hypothetical protein